MADGKEKDLSQRSSFPQEPDLPRETEIPQTVNSPANILPLDGSLGEETEMHEPTDPGVQELIPTGNEIEGQYLPSSDPAGDEEEMDMSKDAQDLEEETEKVNANASSSEDHNLRRSNRVPKPPKIFHYPELAVLLFDTLAWEVKIPKDIHGLQGSCLVIPCSFSYTSYPLENPRRVVWYQWVSKGYPLVYDPADDVIEMFRGKTSLYGNPSNGDCSLLITNLEQSHNEEKLYAWIDPENVGWRTYAFYDVTSTILVDDIPQQPSISIYGGERMGENITMTCSTFHTCPYREPNIVLKGPEGTDKLVNEHVEDGLWKITLTRTGVIDAEISTIECSVTHHGGITVTTTKDKSAKCVHQKIKIEPELAEFTEGVPKNFSCSVYHSCQKETPTITWNYQNMRVSTGSKTLSTLDRVTYSSITFLGSKDDHGKKLICTVKFSGKDITASVVLHVQCE
ncbi:sialic acid-binding Ig-like lectin 12 [Chanodichthys erythropterus]|uniref:sialic acid-binding Ig-like lectin 12 n=1 Tax=Chanodichthys erythropterus TaxID=933992 RepID=UPI00351F3005